MSACIRIGVYVFFFFLGTLIIYLCRRSYVYYTSNIVFMIIVFSCNIFYCNAAPVRRALRDDDLPNGRL